MNTTPANKTFQNSIAKDQYTLIEQSGNAKWDVASKCSAINCFEMHVVRETGVYTGTGNSNLMNLWSIIGHNGA